MFYDLHGIDFSESPEFDIISLYAEGVLGITSPQNITNTRNGLIGRVGESYVREIEQLASTVCCKMNFKGVLDQRQITHQIVQALSLSR